MGGGKGKGWGCGRGGRSSSRGGFEIVNSLLHEALLTGLEHTKEHGAATEVLLIQEAVASLTRGIVMVNTRYVVMTRDRKDDKTYQVGGEWEELESALRFARECLRGNRRKYARVIEVVETRQLAVKQP